ncbi:MAG: hypothetical protein HYY84_01350 [Deltaproteobacteria bacterium]|nr:hypothetical protein [Deltaproteobacteria bacterium]
MFDGSLVGIFVTARKGAPLRAVDEALAVLGRGIEGDRYAAAEGTFSKPGAEGREVTLIEVEAIEAVAEESAIALSPADARRNLMTRGVPLNHLVGVEFSVGGDVVLRGVKLCEPCAHLELLTKKGVREALVHRGGLRAQIVRGGAIRVGDAIRLVNR